MSHELWTAVDRYIGDALIPFDDVLEAALKANAAAGLPAIDVAPNQGKLLHMLALMNGARRILEIGTLGAYSTIWLARALPPDGHLVTLEADPEHARVAASNIARAGLTNIVDIRLGPALETFEQMSREGEEPFDFIFIDADKPNNPEYLKWALRFSRLGTLIIGDNVVRKGAILDPANEDPYVRGTRTFLQMLGQEPRLMATALQTVGSKGYDGFAIALVIA
jgi:predicted O-methyltransferase YrrM